MKKTRISNIGKKRIGRPPVGAVPVMVRIPPSLLKTLDKWKAREMSRPEAIRHLIEFALKPECVDVQNKLAAVDGWIANQNEPGLTRPEAIRRLVEIGLKAKPG
jgi:hypothetical protein